MTRRERRLLLATGAVLLLGVIAWVTGSEGEAPNDGAEASAADSASAATARPATARMPAPAGSAAPLEREFLTFPKSGLDRLLAAVATPVETLPEVDVFDHPRLSDSTAKSREPRGQRPEYRLGGIFRSATASGALVDGRVVFEGEEVEAGVRLRAIQPDGIELERRGRVSFLPFDPLALPPPAAAERTPRPRGK